MRAWHCEMTWNFLKEPWPTSTSTGVKFRPSSGSVTTNANMVHSCSNSSGRVSAMGLVVCLIPSQVEPKTVIMVTNPCWLGTQYSGLEWGFRSPNDCLIHFWEQLWVYLQIKPNYKHVIVDRIDNTNIRSNKSRPRDLAKLRTRAKHLSSYPHERALFHPPCCIHLMNLKLN